MRKYICSIILLFILILSGVQLAAQSLPVGTPVLEEGYRNLQLLGQVDSSVSFTARPFFPADALKVKDSFDPDHSLDKNRWIESNATYTFDKGNGVIKLLPVTWLNQFNSDRPAGLNDGAMIPARGYQTMISGGISFRYKFLSIQLRPELVQAENVVYDGFPHTLYDPVLAEQRWYQYYHYYLNKIDLPERFGKKAYSEAYWGQSSIRLNYGSVSFGLSSENIWWGPGMQNSLLMTNSAPGFTHLTLNTIKPIRTPIGSFEGQLIAGKLEQSGFTPPESDRRYFDHLLYIPKPDDFRYINGMVLCYQPKWVSGLFLGATRSFVVYSKEMGKSIGDFLPVFSPLSIKNAGSASDAAKNRQQLSSIFMRWVWLKAKGEVYLEYGRSASFQNQRDLTVEPSYSTAYILGLRKLIPLRSFKDQYLLFNLELTQLEMNPTTTTRGGQSWYLSNEPNDGYTNRGQMLGAGIGPGSNLQTISISWVKSLKKIGIQFERTMHNNDFFYAYIKDIRSHWVDLGSSLFAEWDYKNLVLNAKVEAIRTLNYEWNYTPPPAPTFWVAGKDRFNYHFQLGITYRF